MAYLTKELKKIAMSLYSVVEGETGNYIKKYSIETSEFGTNIELYIFKDSSGISIGGIHVCAEEIIREFIKDISKNDYIFKNKIIVPDPLDLMVYGGKNKAYIGFTKLIHCSDLNAASNIFEKLGYRKL